MEGFHRRYMVSNKVLRLWAAMARTLDISLLVPQHGAPLAGPAIPAFFDWIENLACGIDLFDERNYQLPKSLIDPGATNSRPAALA
jgi:flavorubredoxin